MSEYIISILILVAIYSILGLSLNLIIGYTGLLSLAHAGFYGIGAYTTAIAMTRYNMDFFTSTALGILIAASTAGFIGLVLSKLKGDMYALASLGLGVIVFSILLNWQSLTNGPLGIAGIPRPKILIFTLDSNFSFLVLSCVFLIVVFVLCHFLVHSPFGRVLQAIREREELTQMLGYRTFFYKLGVFKISAALAAIAGSLFAGYLSFINPSSFNINEAIFLTVIVIIGGLANLWGSLLGAALLFIIPEMLRFLGMPPEIASQTRQFLYGLALILLMLFRPTGIVGRYRM